jgi:hypothetical protein
MGSASNPNRRVPAKVVIPPINLWTYRGAMAAALWLALSELASGQERSAAARAEFQRLHPCPATGERRGPCPGYVVDHIRALACGGPDSADNMQWQTVPDGKLKDRVELYCRMPARGQAPPPVD